MKQLRLKLTACAVALLVVLASALALFSTSAVSAAMPGRIGAPAITTPVPSRTVADQPVHRLAVLGDVGTGEMDELRVAARVADLGASDPFDALVLLGDNVYPDGNPQRLDSTVFGPFQPVLDGGANLLAVLGNHDEGYAAEQVAALRMPGRWYAVEIGDVLFVGLDSTDAENPGQLTWLENTLASSTSRWVIAAMHHPPFSAGVHGSDEETREAFVPLFERYDVDLVLAGHDHDYQRSVPIGDITYVVSGAGSKVRQTGSADFTATSAAVLHFVEIAVWQDRLEISAISLDGTFDHFVIDGSRSSNVTAANFPTGGFLSGDETATGVRLAGIGVVLWLTVMAAAWVLPRAASGRHGRAFVVVSTASMLTITSGIGLVTISLVG